MKDDYLSNRWVIYKGDKGSLKEEMTCGAPQGFRVGPLVWNVMYDDFLRLELPAGTSIIGFADNALVVCAAEDVRILELRIKENLWRTKTGNPFNTQRSFWVNMRLSGNKHQVPGGAVGSKA